MTLNYIQSEIGKLIIDIKKHKHVKQININDIKIKIFSIKMLRNDFKFKNIHYKNALQ